MNRLVNDVWLRLCLTILLPLLFERSVCAGDQATAVSLTPQLITNVTELRDVASQSQGCICAYALEGIVLDADDRSGTLFFQDDSGTEILETDLETIKLLPGQRIQLRGTNYVARTSKGLSLGTRPVVDSDNLHLVIERFGTVYLKAGKHPVRVNWFNHKLPALLRLEYSGPNFQRQSVPDGALYHTDENANDGNIRWVSGLNYRAFEGKWERLPNFDSLVPQKTGVTTNFDITVESRTEDIGLEFKGFLNVPDDGNYVFYLNSDDGSQLFLDSSPPEIRIIGASNVPDPTPIAGGQSLSSNRDSLWAKAEGTITFLGDRNGVANFELMSGESRLHVEILNTPPEIPTYLQHSRVRVQGICPDIRNAAGQKYAGSIIVAEWTDMHFLEVAPENWSAFPDATIGELEKMDEVDGSKIVRVLGHFSKNVATQTVRFEDATGSAPAEILTGQPVETGVETECLCRWSRSGTNIFLHEVVVRETSNGQTNETGMPRILTTALQVQQLTREQALREIPVQILGVVTWISSDYRGLIIQDSTRAVYVWVGDKSSESLPRVGDYCKIRGVSRPADFAPIVALREATTLWTGEMPTPIMPTRDQLLSGTLDAQYVEVRGLVAATHDTYITLLTTDGMLDLNIIPAPGEPLNNLLNSIIRVRGCFIANWDPATHRVIPNQPLHLWSSIVAIDTPPPKDLFQADPVRARELMQFDARFDTFRRVKVSGQIVHADGEVNYMMDDATGLRFRMTQPMPLNPGDEVEVVGLVEIGSASPALRLAVARKTGHAAPPKARHLSMDSLDSSYDSTLVWLEGKLVDIKQRGEEQVLELQVGVKSFVARLNSDQTPATEWPIGSRLKLTGVFSALDGDRLAGRDVNSFELLINSPSDVKLMARPPWWTPGRLLAAVTVLIAGLALAFIWIHSLRRQVERRTLQLHREISQREHTEKLRAIEQERSRIARDLHDDLGSELTEINMMATPVPGLKTEPDSALERLRQIVEKSRSMISSLDGVVWVVNSKNDKLTALIEYLASYAEEFLAKAKIACRVELPTGYSERMIEAEMRHDVLLSVRETLNNAVRHGHPTEVLMQFKVAKDDLEILIRDNGCGFESNQIPGNGLGNLQQRMEKFGGSCLIQSVPSDGTSVILKLPLPK